MRHRFATFVLFGLLHAPAPISSVAMTPAKFEFEVASVKINTTANGVSGGCRGTDSRLEPNDTRAAIPLGRCHIAAARLSHLMTIAYGVQVQRIRGEAELPWGSMRFDVEGKAENASEATEEQLLSMLQNLLEDRFRLNMQRETIAMPGYALVVAKNGPKLKEATREGTASLRISGAEIFKFDAAERKNLDQNTIMGQNVTMAQLAATLGNLPNHGPVVDRTGLGRAYDFKLTWEPGESISSVLQEQMGLKLEAQKVPVDLLIIHSAEKPAAN